MANVLQFALGLSVGNFLPGAGAAKLALGALTTAATGLGVVMAGVWQQVNRGGELNDLSNRTGESVGNLVKLQRGFEMAGVSADSVAGIIGGLQRSLGGVNEMGEPTAASFEAIGLSIEKLKGMDTPAALNEIFGALRQFNRNDAASAAGKIFGRGNGGNILQAARDGEAFAEAMKHAQREADIFQRSAAAMDRIGDALVRIKADIVTVFASLAEKFTAIVGIAQQAFADGKVTQLIFLGISAGMEAAWNFGSKLFADPGFWAGFVQAADSAFKLIGTALVATLGTPLAYIGAWLEKGAQASNGGNKTFDQLLAEQKKLVALGAAGGLTAVAKDMASFVGGTKAMQDAAARAAQGAGGPMQEAFSKLLAEIVAKIPADGVAAAGNKSLQATKNARGGRGRNEAADALTRIGFFSTGRSDPGQETARNTGQLVALTRRMVAQLGKLGGGTADFQNA